MVFSGAKSALLLALVLSWSDANPNLKVLDGRGKERDFESVVTQSADARVVFVGESHDRYDHHLSELEVIRRLHERDSQRWTIGVEFIQRRFQTYLDSYIAGSIPEQEFLKKTEYFDRWGFDFRLYRPIFQYAKDHGVPVIALNAEAELTEKVGKVGLDGLDAEERKQLPDVIDKLDKSYRKRLQRIFKEHPAGGNFEHFWEAQLVWDETMADRAVDYLSSHPDKAMIVLAGSGHMEFGSGIPNRVKRRLPTAKTIVLIAADKKDAKHHAADYFLVSKEEILPPAPKMGIVMEVKDGVRVKSVTPDGAAAKAGVKEKDRIVSVDGEEVQTLGDVRLALLDKNPGDHVTLRVQRDETITLELVLQQ